MIWSAQAAAELRAALDYLAGRSPQAAERLLAETLERAESLDMFPERGRIVPETSDEILREVFVQRFRLMYEVHPGEVRIVTFVHGARDFARMRRKG